MAQGLDAALVVAQARGNPLILLELARSAGAAAHCGARLDRLLQARLSRLSPAAGELLDWAAAWGREFAVESLMSAQGIEPGTTGAFDRSWAELERNELIVAVGETGYEFSHDRIQQTAYGRISPPRRRLMHKSIALQLSRERDDRPEVCTALAQHAGLGAMHELATVAQDRWRQGKCLARATMIELERGQPLRARERAQVLREAASTCDDGAEVALARAINVLTRPPAAQDTSAESSLADLAAAIDDLRTADDKSRLAWVLNFAAVSQWDAGAFKQACVLADDALATALLIGDQTEAVEARATLAQLALAQSDADQARTVARGLQTIYAAPSEFSARARRAAQSPRLCVLAEPRVTSAPVRPADKPTSP